MLWRLLSLATPWHLHRESEPSRFNPGLDWLFNQSNTEIVLISLVSLLSVSLVNRTRIYRHSVQPWSRSRALWLVIFAQLINSPSSRYFPFTSKQANSFPRAPTLRVSKGSSPPAKLPCVPLPSSQGTTLSSPCQLEYAATSPSVPSRT